MSEVTTVIQKLDKRHKGHEHFKYYVQIVAPVLRYGFRFPSILARASTFLEMREQCWRTYGYSCELELYLQLVEDVDASKKLNKHYSWHMDGREGIYRIYLKGDAERAWLSLLWS